MMTLKEIREDYVRYSTNVSNICRNLCFAGIGVVWIFKVTNTTTIPTQLYFPLLLFIVALGLDLLQYFVQTIIWYRYYLKHKSDVKNGKTEDDVVVREPEWINAFTWAIWGLKFFAVIIAYIKVGLYVHSQIIV